jgi:diadenosine tetraphosphatase ApaH/serine/threonine PP2A family protein phosphatase
MRIAALSDVHANLEALDVVLAHVAASAVDAVVCLGDFVGYGPDPNACVERLQAAQRASVAGNHDLAALGARGIEHFNLYAQEAIVWTQRALHDDARAFLTALPSRAELDGLLLVHGSPREPIDEYITTTRVARASFAVDAFRVALVGHTHQPAVFEESNNRVRARGLLAEIPVALSAGSRYIVNVGSVGQPRDGDPRAAYALVDTAPAGGAPAAGGATVTLHRLAYPIEETQRKMESAGLPVPLIERLASGR